MATDTAKVPTTSGWKAPSDPASRNYPYNCWWVAALRDELNREMDRVVRYKRPTSLVMIDIDNFKRYNDTYGHPAGDSLLKCLAATLRSNTRDVDILARYGGEEFAIILPEVGIEGGLLIAERIRLAVAGLYAQQQQHAPIDFGIPSIRMPVTISLGLASAPDFAQSPAELIHAADSALYKAKRSGKNLTLIAEALAKPTKDEISVHVERLSQQNSSEQVWPHYAD